MADRRKKGCPNPDCQMYESKKFDSSQQFCGQCGSPLVYVCACKNCYTKIEDIGPKHSRCERCEAERNERLMQVKEKAGNAGKAIVGVVPAAAAIAGKKLIKIEQSEVADVFVKGGKKAIDIAKDKAIDVVKIAIKK